MNTLLEIALSNAIVVTVLAVIVFLVGRFARYPALCHGLWVLVLVKLVTPPVISVPLPASLGPPRASAESENALDEPARGPMVVEAISPETATWGGERAELAPPAEFWTEEDESAEDSRPIAAEADSVLLVNDSAMAGGSADAPAPRAAERTTASKAPPVSLAGTTAWSFKFLTKMLVAIWLGGAVMVLLATTLRIFRFHRMLRMTPPAPANLQETVRALARQIGIRRCPDVYLLPAAVGPTLWAAWGKPKILFPAKLHEDLASDALRTLLLHELSHLRRRDHWVRFLELVVTILYWWHPVVWWARRQIRPLEEACCDSWVISEMPEKRDTYATALVQAIGFVGGVRTCSPPMTSGIDSFVSTKRRITMIMRCEHHKRLASASADGTVRLWDVASQDETALLTTPAGTTASIAFSPDGKTLADAGQKGAITLWDAESGKVRLKLTGYPFAVWSLAFSPSGRTLASGTVDGYVLLWNTKSGENRQMLRAHDERVTSLAFAPNAGALVSVSADSSIKRWEAVRPPLASLPEAAAALRYVAFTPDGDKLVATGLDGRARVFDADTGALLNALVQPPAIHSSAISTDGKMLATGGRDIRLWDIAAGKRLAVLDGHGTAVRGLAFSPDGRLLLSGGDDKVARIWDVDERRELRSLPPQEVTVWDVDISPDGKTFATATGDYREPKKTGTVKIWDVQTGELLQTLPNDETRFFDVDFSPDGRTLIFSDAQRRVRFWDIKNRSIKSEILCDEHVYTFSLIPSGNLLAAAGRPGAVSIWDVTNGRRLALYEQYEERTYSVAVSPDGTVVASGGDDRSVRLWATPNAPDADHTAANRIRRWPKDRAREDETTAAQIAQRVKTNRLMTLKDWGEIVDPDGDCQISHEDGVLTITVPNTLHDLNKRNGKLNAPRVLQEVEGDFRIQVKVSGEFTPGPESTAPNSSPFNGAGILIWHDDKSYIRLERDSFLSGDGTRNCYPPLFELRNAGKYLGANPPVTSDSFFEGESTYLRIERRGGQFTAFISHDDKEWKRVQHRLVDLPSKLKVGVSALNTSSDPMTVTFEALQVTKLPKGDAAVPKAL